jgi:hypothetical protein
MSTTTAPTEALFIEHKDAERTMLNQVRALEHGCSYVSERFIFHWHLYEIAKGGTERGLVASYLNSLGYRREAANELHDISVERVFPLLERMFWRDTARDEEMVSVEEAAGWIERLRTSTESWALSAFTNLYVPEGKERDFNGYPFVRVTARDNMEGGVFLLGEQDIVMVWFIDDDGPARAIHDREYRR